MWWIGLLACEGPVVEGVESDPPPVPTDTATEVTGHTGDTGTTTPPTDTATTDTGAFLEDLEYAALFDGTLVHTVVIDFQPAEYAQFLLGTNAELPSAITLDGVDLGGGSVRLRGDAADLGWPGKANLSLDLDDDGGRRYGGVERLALDAQLRDPAAAREVIASEVFRRAGIPTPQAVFATVVVQGIDAGLYTLVEGVDRSFIRRHWADDQGDLWAGSDGADFTATGVGEWRPVGSTASTERLEDLRFVVQSSQNYYADLQAQVDVAALHRMWAWQAAVGHTDSWPYELDDVYAYSDPTDLGRLDFVAWRLDKGWDPLAHWAQVDSALAVRCVYDSGCDADVRLAVAAAADEVELMDVPALADTLFALSEDAVRDDLARPLGLAEVAAARASLRAAMVLWPQGLRDQLQ